MGGGGGCSPNSSVGLRAAKKRSKSLLGDWNSSNIKCVYFSEECQVFNILKKRVLTHHPKAQGHTKNSGMTLQRGDSGISFQIEG